MSKWKSTPRIDVKESKNMEKDETQNQKLHEKGLIAEHIEEIEKERKAYQTQIKEQQAIIVEGIKQARTLDGRLTTLMRENDEMSTKIMLLENEAKQSREDEYEIAKQAIVDQTSTMVNLDELKAKAETRLSEANFKVKQLEEEKVFFGGTKYI